MSTALKFSNLLSANIQFCQVISALRASSAMRPCGQTFCAPCQNNAERNRVFNFISRVASVFLLIVRQVAILVGKVWGPPRHFGDGERRCSAEQREPTACQAPHEKPQKWVSGNLRSSPSRWQTRPATDLDRLPSEIFPLTPSKWQQPRHLRVPWCFH